MTLRTLLIVVVAIAFGFACGRVSATSRPGLQPIPALDPSVPPALSIGGQPDGAGRTTAPPSPDWTDLRVSGPSQKVTRTGAVARRVGSDATLPLRGLASWFCSATSPCTAGYPASCLCAAAGPALRGLRWVTVSYGGRAVRVRIIDVCGCPGGRLLDLYRVAFARLADPGLGLITVRVWA